MKERTVICPDCGHEITINEIEEDIAYIGYEYFRIGIETEFPISCPKCLKGSVISMDDWKEILDSKISNTELYEFQKQLKRIKSVDGRSLMSNEWIPLGGNYWMSIQGSNLYYSIPQKPCENPTEYKRYEVMIFNKPKENNPNNYNKTLTGHDWDNYEITKFFIKYGVRHGADGILEYVPSAEVEKLYKLLLEEFKEGDVE